MSKRKLLLKIVVLGDSGVGKTSLLIRYVENKFTVNTKSTIGANFLSKDVEVGEQIATCQIWDTAGQERFQGLGTAFYRGSDGVIFVFDVTNRKSFEELNQWREAFLIQVGQEGNTEFPMLILANKVDMEEKRVVSRKELEKWCQQEGGGLSWMETSAKDGKNVEAAFEKVASLVVARMEPVDNLLDTVDLSQSPSGQKKQGDCGC
ncbi:Ras-related protein Rab7 [Balamuthia mandrillaris]